jgi:hypothetical protein
MILDGKYVILKNKQIKQILPILIENGYIWGYTDESYYIETKLYKKFDRIIIASVNTLIYYYPCVKEFIDWNKNLIEIKPETILREYKLKRILK